MNWKLARLDSNEAGLDKKPDVNVLKQHLALDKNIEEKLNKLMNSKKPKPHTQHNPSNVNPNTGSLSK